MTYEYNDGGRKLAGYKGDTGDCVVRAIAIATGKPYAEVYEAMWERNAKYAVERNTRAAKKMRSKGSTPRSGNYRDVYEPYLKSLGWRWVPTMKIGQGCKVHLRADELPGGRIIASVSKHLCAVVDGVIQDTHDPSRDGTRCVYGYYEKTEG